MTWKCSNCKTESDDTVEVCWKCGYAKTGSPTSISNSIQSGVIKKYPALRAISRIYSVMAWIIGVLAVLVAIYFIIENLENSILYAMLSILIGALLALGIYAIGELIMVQIDIEENTRMMAGE